MSDTLLAAIISGGSLVFGAWLTTRAGRKAQSTDDERVDKADITDKYIKRLEDENEHLKHPDA